MANFQLHLGDCLEFMRSCEPNSVDTVICDPPYALTNRTPDVKWCVDCKRVLGGRDGKPDVCPKCGGALEYQRSQGKRGFMGKEWDAELPSVEIWAECLRIAKPGAMLLAFGGSRTHHRLMVAIEDAGWEIRDVIMWVYGSGFPKSHDISKGIDKAAGVEREVVGRAHNGAGNKPISGISGAATDAQRKTVSPVRQREGVESFAEYDITAPSTSLAQQWDGWGTALKPAYEPVILAMKPLDGTFAQNAGKWGVAGLAIDKGRIGHDEPVKTTNRTMPKFNGQDYNNGKVYEHREGFEHLASPSPSGRWPANLILDEEAAMSLDEQSGVSKSVPRTPSKLHHTGSVTSFQRGSETSAHNDTGGASRFFYCAKASRSEREQGLEGMEERTRFTGGIDGGSIPLKGSPPPTGANIHPTVKPLALMRYLVRLTSTPTGGIVLDPFMGSGSTGVAAIREGRGFIGCELDADYFEIAKRRIGHAASQLPLFSQV